MPHGGKRRGAGRPKGQGPYGEKTRVMRVPESQFESIRAFLDNNGYRLPLYASSVAAGLPSPVDSDIEDHIDVCGYAIKHPKESFCVRVSGESMIGAGIDLNDILVVDSRLEPKHGNIVIALIDGKTTVKRFYKKGEVLKLVPENPDFPEILLKKNDRLQIQGVVVHIMKSTDIAK